MRSSILSRPGDHSSAVPANVAATSARDVEVPLRSEVCPVIEARNVTKEFRIKRNQPGTIRETLTQKFSGTFDTGSPFCALRNVSFTVTKGSVMGIIGHNGAGNILCSGCCRDLAGFLWKYPRPGNIGTLLELGNGFNAEMTGRENLLTGGILSGLTKNEVREVEKEIISFAELEQFIDQPVRTYSSGMYMRLAFATAMHFKSDILMIDEVLAVGDARFRKKCIDKASQFRSHDKSSCW